MGKVVAKSSFRMQKMLYDASYGGLAENVTKPSYGGRGLKLTKKTVIYYLNVPISW